MKFHQGLTEEKWSQYSLAFQMANIGSEVFRAIKWRNANNTKYSFDALARCLELLDLSIATYSRSSALKELTRLREVIVDFFAGDNQYGSSEKLWESYFMPFTHAAAKERGHGLER